MSGAIEDLAKKWLAEPAYNKVFKHTFDVIEDYLCYCLTGIGSIALAVRFLTSLGTGQVICAIQGVSYNNTSTKNLGPYPSGSTTALVNYANQNQDCSDAALTSFMQYLPFFLLLQAVAIILMEKMLTKLPRVAGKIERFYGTIVEESLFGKDPDVAEDVCDTKANFEAISRKRQRNEICMALKRSSIIHTMYIVKNILQIILLLIFIPVNITFGLEAEVNLEPSSCTLDLGTVPQLGLEAGQVFLQCEGKKVVLLLRLLYVQVVLMLLVAGCSAGSLLWCLCLRSISRLLTKIEVAHPDWDFGGLEPGNGKDFLFLFDLLSHNSGIESTLRVLTHADETFRKICIPKISNECVRVEEDKLKIEWKPAGLELWLRSNKHKGIAIDSYDVTIFPAETVNNSKSLLPREIDSKSGNYTAWFYDLQGGRTEYVITIACVIGKSRMKGERIVTTLLPYGPGKPRAGILKAANTEEVEISWEPPKGGFTKYMLWVDPSINTTLSPKHCNYSDRGMFNPRLVDFFGSRVDLEKVSIDVVSTRELSNLLTEHKIPGLSPGCTYGILLKTITGSRQTRQPVFECVMTKPLPVEGLQADETTTNSVRLCWVPPPGHKRLKYFNVTVQSNDGKTKKELAVVYRPDTTLCTYQLTAIPSGTEFSASIFSVCVFEKLKSQSEVEKIVFRTQPEAPTHLTLESRYPNSFTVKWEPPSVIQGTHRYHLSIEAAAISYSEDYTVRGDKGTFNFSKLPDITGTGEQYTVKVEYVVTPNASSTEVASEPLMGTFTTKPLPPTNLDVVAGLQAVSWVRSATPNVHAYKVRWKSTDEGSKSEEAIVTQLEGDGGPCSLELQGLVPGVYKINIYALVEDPGQALPVESKELHEKVVLLEGGQLSLYTEEMERASAASGLLSRQQSNMMA